MDTYDSKQKSHITCVLYTKYKDKHRFKWGKVVDDCLIYHHHHCICIRELK